MVQRQSGSEFEIAEPEASALIESLRAFSYDLSTALADLIDNSITAGAGNVWVDFHWDGAESVIAITDDGKGMTEAKLVEAMRPGSQNPLIERAPHDLGRFGLGLKTASFSQCRRLTVRTFTKSNKPVTRCWDLDHVAQVNQWQLLKTCDSVAEAHSTRLNAAKSGTAVIWQRLDRLVAGNRTDCASHQQHFLERAEAVRKHLSLVFHQWMSGRKGLKLFINDRQIEPWDPFLADEVATQALPPTRIKTKCGRIEIEPFVLPHHSKITKEVHTAGAGPRGWNAHQGFYIYRNKRLLVPGDWLGFGWAKEEHFKLARIKIELPNSVDHEWEIDVTKSRAMPPACVRDEIRRIGEKTRSLAKRIYSHRGARISPSEESERVFLWEPTAKHGKTFYKINRAHPLVKQAQNLSSDSASLSALLRLIEETVPFPHITISNSERPESLPQPFEHANDSMIREVMREAFESLVGSGYQPKDAVNRLRTIWPFELFPALLQTFSESHNA